MTPDRLQRPVKPEKRPSERKIVVLYLLWVSVLIAVMVLAWSSTLFALPGNWVIVAIAAVFAYFVHPARGVGIHWTTVTAAAVLAAIAEGVELLAGAAGAKRAGAGRRSMVLSLAGTMIGSLVGAILSVPIPIVGPVVGALGGGALGAFVGAFLGEASRGRDTLDSLAAGRGALIGRLWGTAGKLAIGLALIVIITVDAIL